MYKTVNLERANIKSIVGCAANDYSGQVAIVPVTKRGMSNTTASSGSGEYDGGDRVIGFGNGYEIDGDLLFTVGWGDGFALRRLNDDGTMTKLYHEDQFLWRDTTSTYNHLNSVAIDKGNKLGVAMTYNVEGYTTFDYSGCVNGGSTFIKDPRPTHSNPDVFIGSQDMAGGYVNRVGVVVNVPKGDSSGVKPGDEVIVHHNVFRRFYDVKGNEKNSRSYFNENSYMCTQDQIYMYRRDGLWKPTDGYCFVKPIESNDIWSLDNETPFKGVLKILGDDLLQLGLQRGNVVGFTPRSEYEFVIDNERMYRVRSVNINIDYGHKRNEKEYNPSWA